MAASPVFETDRYTHLHDCKSMRLGLCPFLSSRPAASRHGGIELGGAPAAVEQGQVERLAQELLPIIGEPLKREVVRQTTETCTYGGFHSMLVFSEPNWFATSTGLQKIQKRALPRKCSVRLRVQTKSMLSLWASDCCLAPSIDAPFSSASF